VILAFCHEARIRKEKAMKEKRVEVKGAFRKNLLLFLGIMVLFCFAGAVQAAQKPSRFQEVKGSSGFIIRDNTTGLEWQRCPYGQIWTGSTCSGAAWQGNWYDAVRITAPGGFRLPTIDELQTLAPYDLNVFPGAGLFWSSSSNASYSGNAWYLFFNYAYVYYGFKSDDFQARLVRGGQ
jgi:hypothetical protein